MLVAGTMLSDAHNKLKLCKRPEILLKVALNTITPSIYLINYA
jgi:hypothetical protein